jgi:peptidoglycan/xylan/chitin deacetylase (PgdA/CDA1 family)
MPPLVLAYHAVARAPFDGMAAEMVVTADALAEEVRRLQRLGRRFVPASQAAGDAAVLTFDDGWADALTVAAPLLAELGVPATFYVSPGLFGNTEDSGYSPEGRVLTVGEACELHALEFELGAHSLHHPDLTSVDDDVLRAELEGSKSIIEDITGEECRTFAYPFGLHDARVRAAARAAGYELAFQFAPGPWGDPFAAPRTPKPAY